MKFKIIFLPYDKVYFINGAINVAVFVEALAEITLLEKIEIEEELRFLWLLPKFKRVIYKNKDKEVFSIEKV